MERTREISSIPLAIIGMGCRLPGADNLEEFWRLIVEGQNAIKEVPADRLNQDLYYDPKKGVRGKTYSKLGAVISNRPLNRRILPVPHDLERSIDVAHARMCEVAAAACRHAGMDPFNLPRATSEYTSAMPRAAGFQATILMPRAWKKRRNSFWKSTSSATFHLQSSKK